MEPMEHTLRDYCTYYVMMSTAFRFTYVYNFSLGPDIHYFVGIKAIVNSLLSIINTITVTQK